MDNMDDKQREAVFSLFLSLLFSAAAIFLNLFNLGAQPLYSLLALLSSAVLGYLISLKGGQAGLKPLHAVIFLLAALFVASVKTELGILIIPTLAFPVAAVLLLSFMGPLRASLFRKGNKGADSPSNLVARERSGQTGGPQGLTGRQEGEQKPAKP
ncbi:MAG: hypothetical protein NTY83_03590 [Candidatus Micrarchaeota archaeon]|nr:hypothetical protein [Candidatus Micrarchaeota archaeon]